MKKKFWNKSAVVCAIIFSLAVTGCGKNETSDLLSEESVTEQELAASNQVVSDGVDMDLNSTYKKIQELEDQSTEDKNTEDKNTEDKNTESEHESDTEKNTESVQNENSDKVSEKDTDDYNYSLIATFDDGELILNKNGISVKDDNGQAIIFDGKIDIKDKDGNFQLTNDELVIKDILTGSEAVRFDKSGFHIDGDVVSWDDDGFHINAEDFKLNLDIAFPGLGEWDEIEDSGFMDSSEQEKWNEFSKNMSSFFCTTINDIVNHSLDFIHNKDWKSWDHVTIMDSDETINGINVHAKIWFDDGYLKTMNIPEENLTVEGYSLVETMKENGNVIRTYH